MERLIPRPPRRRGVSARIRRLAAAAWLIASVAVPVAGLAAISTGAVLLPPESAFTYTVEAGDTLSAIARRYGVTVEEIMSANGLTDPNRIYVGDQLVIPRLDDSGQTIHTVQAGESLSIIARRYGVTVEALAAANGLSSPDSLSAGQRLIVPGGSAAAADPGLTYTLQRGESLYRVSLIFGVTVDDLLAANSLASPNAIYPGLTLRIPLAAGQSAAGARTHTVAPGDTLAAIAVQYGVTVDGIVAANGLTRADLISVGQTLILPEPGQTARAAPARSAVTHRVLAGQTLSEIALRYGVTVHALAVANGIDNPARIAVGQVLSIPSAQAGSVSVEYASVGEGLCEDAELRGTGTGYFIRPTSGYVVTQEFLAWHPGIDLAQDSGNPVYASDSGTVIYAGWNPAGYGNLVVLDHGNGWRTYYAHLSVILPACGDWVSRGSQLGEVGSTGNSTGPHLHFEMLRYGIAVNPSGYIRFP